VRRQTLAPLLGAFALPLTGCAGWQSALDPQGAPAADLKQLILMIVVVCTVVWFLVVGALLRALYRGRDNTDDQPLRVEARLERRMGFIVAAAVAATTIVITIFTVASFFTTRNLAFAKDDDLTIRVRGLQWWWEVKYLDAKGDMTFATANEIHIPVGRNVRIQLEGADVIHSFWVPSLAGKQDLIPGRPNELTLQAQRPGVYRGQCAEFCGVQHAHMAFFVVAEDADAFANWTRSQRENAAAPANAEIAAGQQLFLSKPCAACHTVRGTSAAGTTGPDLTHVGGRQSIAAGLLETTRGSLAAWIADPQTLKPGNNMPMVPMSPEELRSISAYMASLR
jgi:cytochrome c oxidase subunit 2